MPKHVAFLRAINVGGRRAKMDQLCELFEELGLADVDSYLASGNIVFASQGSRAELERRIEAHLEEALGYAVETFVRTLDELEEIAQSTAFADEAKQPRTKRYVAFLKEELSGEQEHTLVELADDVDRFLADGRTIWWLRHIDAGESMPTSEVTKALDVVATRRTFTTIERLVKKYG